MAAKRMQLDLATTELEAALQREAELAHGEWGREEEERGWKRVDRPVASPPLIPLLSTPISHHHHRRTHPHADRGRRGRHRGRRPRALRVCGRRGRRGPPGGRHGRPDGGGGGGGGQAKGCSVREMMEREVCV